MGFFKLSTDREKEEAPEKFEEYKEERFPTYDARRAFRTGFEDIGQMVGGALEYGARKLDMPVVADKLRSAVRTSKAVSESISAGMSERGRKAAEAPIFETEEGEQTIWDDPATSIGLKAIRMVPTILASAIPGTILARIGLGTVGAVAGTGATGGVLGAGETANAVIDEINALTHEELMANSKVYQTEIENGVDPEDAKETIRQIALDEAVPLAALIHAGTNMFGPEALLAKALGGQIVRKGLARGVAEGVATSVPSEAIEGGTTSYLSEQAGETYGGKDFSWLEVAEAMSQEGFMGGLFGGVGGGAVNIRGRKKAGGPKAKGPVVVETTAAATPNAAETAALAPPASPAKTAKSAPTVKSEAQTTPPLGPPTVQQPGTETPPPGSKIEHTRRRYKKPSVAAGTETVQPVTLVAPDPTQAAAVQAAKPLVRRRAQAELAASTAQQPPAAPPVEPPVSAQPPAVAPAVAPPVAAGAQPDIRKGMTPAEALRTPAPQVPAAPPPSPPIVLGKVAPTGRILPDLQAQKRQQEEFERRAAKPDEVAGRGRRYEQTEASVMDPKQHKAWRLQRIREVAKGDNPSPIAIEVAKIKSKPGIDMPEPMRKHLQDLHRKWLEQYGPKATEEKSGLPATVEPPRGQRGQLALPGGAVVVKNPGQFVLAAARAAQEVNANPSTKERIEEFRQILLAAPNRDDINQELRGHPFVQRVAVLKEKLDNGTATEEDVSSFEQFEREFTTLSQKELDAQTRDIEASIHEKGGTGTVEIAARAEEGESESSLEATEAEEVADEEVDEDPRADEREVTTKASKTPIVEEGTFGPASDVRKPKLSPEELARYTAPTHPAGAGKPPEAAGRGKAEVQPPLAKTQEPELPKQVTEYPSLTEQLPKIKTKSGYVRVDDKFFFDDTVKDAKQKAAEYISGVTTDGTVRATLFKDYTYGWYDPEIGPDFNLQQRLAKEKFLKNKAEPRVFQDVRKPEPPKKAELKKKAAKRKEGEKTKKQEREDAINELGLSILEMRRNVREEIARTGKGDERLIKAIADSLKILKEKFGQPVHDRVVKQVEAALSLPGTQSSAGALTLTPAQRLRLVRDTFARVNQDAKLRERARAEAAFDKAGIPIPGKLELIHESTVERLLDTVDFERMAADWGDIFYKHTDIVSSAMFKMIVPRVKARVSNVPVYIVSDKSWSLLVDHQNAVGVNVPRRNAIYIKESQFKGHPSMFSHTLLHEAVHAAFVMVAHQNPTVKKALTLLLSEVRKELSDTAQREGTSYMLHDEDELVAEAFSNPRAQLILSLTQMSPELAKELGMHGYMDKSVWAGFVNIVRKLFGLSPKFISLMDGIIKVSIQGALVTPSVLGDVKTYTPPENDPFLNDYIHEQLNQQMPETASMQAQAQSTMVAAVRKSSIPRTTPRGWVLNLATLHQLTQMADRYFPKGMAVKVSDVVEKIRLRRADLIGAAQDRVVTQLHKLQKKYNSGEFAEMQDIADRATSANIHPDVPLLDPRNKHVKKSAKWMYARMEHADLYKRWQALPAELKLAWHDARTYLVDQQNRIVELHLQNIVEQVLGRKDDQLAQRIFNGTMNSDDEAVFVTNGVLRAMARSRELKKIKGVYFPKMRRGDFVVTGRYKLPQWEKHRVTHVNGKETDEARYTFHDSKDYGKFVEDMRKRGISVIGSRTFTVDDVTGKRYYTYTDPVTGQIVKDQTGAPKQFQYSKGDTDTHTVFEATVQDRLMEMYESEKVAKQAEAELRADGNYEIDGVVKHRELNVHTNKATSRQIKSALASMEKSGQWGRMSDAQKTATKQAFLELSLSFVASTAPQNRARPRRNVLGASKDLVRNVAEYAAASSGSIANLENQPELDKAFDDLNDYEKKYRYQTGDITLPRSQILQKMEDNAYADDGTAPTKRNRLINATLALSFMDKLVSPGYHLINMMQPWMVSVPLLGGRYGFARSTMELGRAYKDMGFHGALWSGIKDTKRATTDFLEGTTDYIADIRKKLAKQKDGAELADMLDYLHERGLIDKDAGMEIAELINSGTKGERVLHRVDHVVRQFGTAVEVVNRVTTGIAAYRMERAKGASIQDAKVHAQETVANSQGNYSMSNAPAIFKHPLGRLTLQFKKFAQLQYFLMSKLAYNALKGASRAEKLEAAKSLTALLVAHAAMAGAVGLPTEPIKIPWMLLSLFLPMPAWEEIENGATEYAQSFLGDNLGDAVTHGLPRLVGIDLSTRVGLNSLVMFGEPRDDKESSVKAWLYDTVLGAPVGLGGEKIKGIRSLLAGEFGDAAEKLSPFKILSDTVKSFRRMSEGKLNKRGEQVEEPWGVGQAFAQILGFRPASDARRQEKTSAYFTQAGNRKAERQELLDEFTTTSDRAAVRKKILKYNASVPKNARIKLSTLSQLLKRKARDKKKGYVKQGVYGGKLNQDLLEKYIGE